MTQNLADLISEEQQILVQEQANLQAAYTSLTALKANAEKIFEQRDNLKSQIDAQADAFKALVDGLFLEPTGFLSDVQSVLDALAPNLIPTPPTPPTDPTPPPTPPIDPVPVPPAS